MSEKATPDYTLGSSGQLAWKEKYFFGPKGIGFLEPGIVGLDDPDHECVQCRQILIPDSSRSF